jgi:hypothetical protein
MWRRWICCSRQADEFDERENGHAKAPTSNVDGTLDLT